MLSMKQFAFALKSANPNIRWLPGPGPCSMLYLYQPRNPDGTERGLIELAAFPSPGKFESFPKWDFFDYTGRRNRGYTTVFRILAGKKAVSPAVIKKFVPDAFDKPQKAVLAQFKKPKKAALPLMQSGVAFNASKGEKPTLMV